MRIVSLVYRSPIGISLNDRLTASLIAMFVVGGVLLIAFGLWEWFGTSHPIVPRRILNRTFVCCVIIGT